MEGFYFETKKNVSSLWMCVFLFLFLYLSRCSFWFRLNWLVSGRCVFPRFCLQGEPGSAAPAGTEKQQLRFYLLPLRSLLFVLIGQRVRQDFKASFVPVSWLGLFQTAPKNEHKEPGTKRRDSRGLVRSAAPCFVCWGKKNTDLILECFVFINLFPPDFTPVILQLLQRMWWRFICWGLGGAFLAASRSSNNQIQSNLEAEKNPFRRSQIFCPCRKFEL